VPVVVAADHLKAGDIMTFDLVSQRPVPARFATAAMLRPDDASQIIGYPTRVDLESGDTIPTNEMGAKLTIDDCQRQCAAIQAVNPAPPPPPSSAAPPPAVHP
jgi:hypothetical protein